MKSWFFIFLVCSVLNPILRAQIFEDFSDGDLQSAPAWQGDVDDFIVNSEGQLQLMAEKAGSSFIYLMDSVTLPYSWKLELSLLFDPSLSNRVRIYLALDKPDPNAASGIFLELGENGDDDVWHLFHIKAGVPTLIARGVTSFATKPAVQLQVFLDTNRQVLLKTGDGAGPADEIQFESNSLDFDLPKKTYFGLQCIYTSTRTEGFIFDNIVTASGPSSLALELVDVISPNDILLKISAPVDRLAAEDPLIYDVQPGIGSPYQSILSASNQEIKLAFAKDIEPFLPYTLQIEGITDLNGVSVDLEAQFLWSPEAEINPYQIIINEIFADPNPSVGLPEVEFIELYYPGPTGPPIDLHNLKISNSGTVLDLPSSVMRPGEFTIICKDEDAHLLHEYGSVAGLEVFPALRNDGDDLALQTQDNAVIHRISYDRSWYHDSDRDDGGYSLEMINPHDPCTQKRNWKASQSMIGGTPGSANSVLDPDTFTPFEITSIIPQNDLFSIIFNKQIKSFIPSQIQVVGEGLSLDSASHLPLSDRLALHLNKEPGPGAVIEIKIDSVLDCLHQTPVEGRFEIVIPQQANAGDIIINEILFNPHSGGSDFIEILNMSNKHVLLSDLFISNTTRPGDVIKLKTDHVFKPGEHVVLTPNTIDILSRYHVPNPHWLHEHELPALNNDSGNVTVYRSQGGEAVIIDAVDYSASYHSPFLREHEGVSLERVDPTGSSADRENWSSASSLVGFGTPTGRNSQNRPSLRSQDQFFLDPKVFSPDGDGVDDFLRLHYTLPDHGYFGSLMIYDASGRLVNHLINNESWDQTGIIRWDGQLESGLKAPVGIYILRLELLTAEGDQIRWKVTCVLAGKL